MRNAIGDKGRSPWRPYIWLQSGKGVWNNRSGYTPSGLSDNSAPGGKLTRVITGDDSLLEGLYESLITQALAGRLADDATHDLRDGAIDEADEPDVLARHVRDVTLRALRREKDAAKRLAMVNHVADALGAGEESLSTARQLLAVAQPPTPGALVRTLLERPSTPLSDAALLTNAPGEPGVGHEIRAELASADSVDVIMAFVKWYGLRLFEDEFIALRDRGIPIRVITTTYMGVTERAALDRLVNDLGAQVKVQYDAQRTRLHAKAWLSASDWLRHGICRVEQSVAGRDAGRG